MAVGDIIDRDERPAYVQFERRAVEDKPESEKQGLSISKDVDFVKVTPPYSKDCYVQQVDVWFKNVENNVKNNRTPQLWLDHWKQAYEAFLKGQDAPLLGTPIRDWSAISPAQIKNLIHLNILTIEDLANANDEGLKRIGMGAVELRNKARNWLQAANDHGPLVMKVTALENENNQLKGTIESLQNKIQALTQQIGNIANQNLQIIPEGISAEEIIESVEEKTELEILRDQYRATFGKEPHHLMRERGLKIKLGLMYGEVP